MTSVNQNNLIFDVSNQYCCIWDEIAFCEISRWEKDIPSCKNDVILDTGKKEWILLTDKRSFYIEIKGVRRNMWIGKPISAMGKEKLQHREKLPIIPIMYARCKKSMEYLDPLIRQYALDIDYEKNKIYAIKAVAGSGKTTTLIKLAEENKDKKIIIFSL